jgi:molybdate transport system substrate-binding protein
MKLPHTIAVFIWGLTLMISPIPGLQAAELRVIAGGSLTGVLGKLGPQFEQAYGHTLIIDYDSTPNIIAKIISGMPFDVTVVPSDVFKDAGARNRVIPTPIIDVVRAGYGVAVRAGAAKPDISTSDALKKTLLDAQSITFVPASASGAYILKVFDRLGIAEAMKAKTKVQTGPGQIVPAVVSGEAELGIFVTQVLIAPGVDLVGPFPAELQQDLVFQSALASAANQPDAANQFRDFLTKPAAAAVFRAAGMNPG